MDEVLLRKSKAAMVGSFIAAPFLFVGGLIILFVVILPDESLKQSPVWIAPISLFIIGIFLICYGLWQRRLPEEVIVLRGSILFLVHFKKEIIVSDITKVFHFIGTGSGGGRVHSVRITDSTGATFAQGLEGGRKAEALVNLIRQRIKEITGREVSN